ncbi:hypothetical protein DH2020_006641 [Rehmannia glutinosa]|uniref:RING-type E3 ubiquitin transferase n=1 Tax=Rehmannia glutinosa TaxID=99300 RepID=A0ABR0XJH7_REHGL
MQRERSALDSFPEPIDLNQGSHPSNTPMDHSASWDNMLNPVENRLSNYMLGPTDGSVSCINAANETSQIFSGWDRGESSSSANNIQDGDDSKTNLGWSAFYNSRSGSDPTSENWSFEPRSNISISSRSSNTNNYSSNHASLNLNSNNGHVMETEQIPKFYASSSNVGPFSGSSSASLENNDASFGNWGSSCKRKALEGTSGQFYPGGSSSSNQNIMQHPGNLSISSPPFDLSPTNYSQQISASNGVGINRQSPGFFPSPSVPAVSESSSRNFTTRSNHGRHERVLFDTPRGTSMNPNLRSPMTMPMNPNLNQSHLVHVNEARGMHPYPWNGSYGSRSSSSFMVSGERNSGAREEVNNVRSSRRNTLADYSLTVSAPETRNIPQDQIDWSFAPGTSLSSRNHSSGSRVGPSSGGRSSWLPHQNQTSQNHQRLSEAGGPWIPFHRVESESGVRRSQFTHLPSTSSSSDEAATSSRAQHQLDQRSAALLLDMPGEDINGWRALAAVEGRHRLIRQMLTAMRRGVHLQAEEYMLVDPFISGFAELHDRHRDMRLDVDNMSYEELLALEERIGNVSTGLNEEQIRGSMKQRKYEAMRVLPNLEPCCICQENYITGDDIGILECGHEFHTGCIKQWLTVKNLCPICKTTALET